MLEVIKRGSVAQLTVHLNLVDSIGSIRFTYEEETEGQIPFLDTLLIRKEDGMTSSLAKSKQIIGCKLSDAFFYDFLFS